MPASKKPLTKKRVIFIISAVLTLFISMLYCYVAGDSLNESIAYRIYDTVHNPEEKVIHSHYSHMSYAQRKAVLEQIVIENKNLKGIFYIKDGKYVYSDRDTSINKTVVTDLANKVDEFKNNAVYFYINKKDIYGSPAFIYMFKFGSGYYQMIFYKEAISIPESLFSVKIVSDIDHDILSGKQDIGVKLAHSTLHGVGISVITGITLKHFAYVYLVAFVIVTALMLLLFAFIERVVSRQNNFNIDIRAGLKNNEFIPYYQGIYSVEKEKFVGAELLCRWNYKGEKILTPASFINILEDSGKINAVTLGLLNQLARDKALFDAINPDMYFSVNITINMLLDNAFVASVIQFIDTNPQLDGCLTFELTERDKRFDYISEVKQAMCLLHSHGIRWALDDFGTGYSNLLTMHKLPIDIIKVDRMFISSKNDIISCDILTKIVDLLDTWKLPIIMEGVETEAELSKVKHLSIDLVQGFYFSKPMAVKEFTHYLRS